MSVGNYMMNFFNQKNLRAKSLMIQLDALHNNRDFAQKNGSHGILDIFLNSYTHFFLKDSFIGRNFKNSQCHGLRLFQKY